MPKKDSASIKFTVVKNKAKDGKVPLAIQICWNKKVVSRYTGIFVSPSNWNGKEISKREPNAAFLNQQLNEIFQKANNKRLEYERLGQPYEAKDLLIEERPKNELDFESLYVQMCLDRHVGRRNYDLTLRNLKKYLLVDNVTLEEITKDSLYSMLHRMEDDGYKTSYIQSTLKYIACVYNYAIERKLVSRDSYPVATDMYTRYRPVHHHRALSEVQMACIKDFYINHFFVVDVVSGQVYAKPTKVDYNEVYSYFFSLTLFLQCYYAQGLAPVDMLKMKRSQVRIINDEDVGEYIEMSNVYRSKTNQHVPIAIELDDMVRLLFLPYMERNDGEFLLPFYNRNPNLVNEEAGDKNLIATASKNLKIIWQRVNEASKDVECFEPIPPDTTLYSARHSFSTNFLQAGGNPYQLAGMLGRGIEGISSYVKELNSSKDILAVRKLVYGKKPDK